MRWRWLITGIQGIRFRCQPIGFRHQLEQLLGLFVQLLLLLKNHLIQIHQLLLEVRKEQLKVVEAIDG